MKKFLNSLAPWKSSPVRPTIDSYGQTSSGVSPEQIQSVMEWLFVSLLHAGYFGKSHIIWCSDANPDPESEKVMKKAMRRGEPVFLYRCNGRVQPSPSGHWWRMMSEHPSMRIYQLEEKEGEM